MASKEELEGLIGKVIMDSSFRDKFLKNPKASASEVGVQLTPEQMEAFKKKEFSMIVGELEKVVSKSGFGWT
jgi:hypothetical protein